MTRNELRVGGMSCTGCEDRIRRAVEELDGVVACVAERSCARVRVSYDERRVDLSRIEAAVRGTGYTVLDAAAQPRPDGARRQVGGFPPAVFAAVAILLGALLVGLRATGLFARIPEIGTGIGYGLLVAVGLLTSVHCVAMCGAIGLSQSVSSRPAATSAAQRLRPAFLYNAGRVVAYTTVGAVAGAVGSVIGFTRSTQGVVVAVAGLAMLLMGVNLLGFLPGLGRLLPRMPRGVRRLAERAGGSRPFVVGLLNGLMPCGPLQSMQLYALGAGGAAQGALAMLLFSLGTVPAMLGFGVLAALIPRRAQARLVGVSALLVAFLGAGMVARGVGLVGVPAPAATATAVAARRQELPAGRVAVVRGGVQYVETTLSPSRYEPIVVQAGIPLRWTIEASSASITGCNSPMVVPAWGVEKRLVPGRNVIEVVPGAPGDVRYSCWMGMIRSVIHVVDGDRGG